jgi:hypothetical protein
MSERREGCVVQSAETVLDVLRERGRRGLQCDELYRQLFNPQLGLIIALLACCCPFHLSDPGKSLDPRTSLRVPPG